MAAWQAILHAHDNSFCNLIWQVHKRRVKTIVDIHGLCAVKSYEIMKSCSECAILAHVHTGIICLVLSDMYTITKHAYSLELSRHIHILSHDLRQILWYIATHFETHCDCCKLDPKIVINAYHFRLQLKPSGVACMETKCNVLLMVTVSDYS